METLREELRKSLHTMLTQAEIDFDMWIAMRKARQNDDVVLMLNRRYGRFYMAAENALFNSLITILYAVFERRCDSVNFWKLKEIFPENADPTSLKELEKACIEIKKHGSALALFATRLLAIRHSSEQKLNLTRLSG